MTTTFINHNTRALSLSIEQNDTQAIETVERGHCSAAAPVKMSGESVSQLR